MAMRPPNQQSGGTGTTVKAKSKASSPAGGTTSGKGKYQWATGGKVHSVSQATHDQRVQTQRTLGTQDLTAPPTGAQAVTEANSAADLQFGPQIAAAQQQQANVAPWFRDYLARVAGYATAAQKLAAPVVDQAQGYQQGAAAQMPAGLDPNSAAGQQAAQAASGRQALAQLGLDALQGNATATQDFFGGQQAAAAKDEPGAQTAAANALAGWQSQHAAAVNGFLTTARQNAQNYAIARGTLNLNNSKAQSDALAAGGYDPVTGQPLPPKPPTASDQKTAADLKYFQEHGYYPPTGPPSTPKPPKTPGLTPAQQRAADDRAAKALQGRRTSSNKEASRVTDIVGRIPTYAARPIKTGTTVKNPDGSTTVQTRKATPEDVRNMLIGDGFTADEIALALKLQKPGQKLTADEIALAHRMGITHVPKSWRPTTVSNQPPAVQTAPDGSGGSRPT